MSALFTEVLPYPNRVCSKHGPYNQREFQDIESIWGSCDECESAESDYDEYALDVDHITEVVSDIEDVLKGRYGIERGDVRVKQAFDLLNGVLGEMVIKKNEMHSQLVK